MSGRTPVSGWTTDDYRRTLAGSLEQMREHGAEHAQLAFARVAFDCLHEAGDTAGLAGVAGELDGYEQQLVDVGSQRSSENYSADAGYWAAEDAGAFDAPVVGLEEFVDDAGELDVAASVACAGAAAAANEVTDKHDEVLHSSGIAGEVAGALGAEIVGREAAVDEASGF